MARFLKSVEIEMHSAENTADVLTDAELNDVNGGILAAIVAAGALGAAMVSFWDNPIGYCKCEQAEKVGLGHLVNKS